MKRLIALRETYYYGTRHTGDGFDCDDDNATIFVGLGYAKAAPEKPAQPAPAPPPNPAPAQPLPPKRRGRYPRRDMRPEE